MIGYAIFTVLFNLIKVTLYLCGVVFFGIVLVNYTDRFIEYLKEDRRNEKHI